MADVLPPTIGNDVVDLAYEATQPPLHPRYLKRVLSKEELSIVEKAPERLWEFWTVKEAAYKAIKRCRPECVFAHSQFVYRPELNTVIWKDIVLRVYIKKTSEYVIASCTNEDERHVLHYIQKTNNNISSSLAVRELAIQSVSHSLGIVSSRITIENQARSENVSWASSTAIPLLYIDNVPSQHLLSLSHHGNFVGCATLIIGASL